MYNVHVHTVRPGCVWSYCTYMYMYMYMYMYIMYMYMYMYMSESTFLSFANSTSPVVLQHVCLDHLNLRLADAEFSVDAFAAFRSSQLQPLRAFLLDPSSALPHRVELSGREMTGERGREGAAAGELQDLILVRNVRVVRVIVRVVRVQDLTW